ncbi:hypothetical protein REPUB_Repub01dG0159500 [Reevesia pubescens]
MPNGSLGEVLHRKKDGHLHSDMRYKIAVEAAKGLCYLHHDCSPLIVHRDVKSNNILLDSDFEAHVADFSLAKFLQDFGTSKCMSAITGSYGYIVLGSKKCFISQLLDRFDIRGYARFVNIRDARGATLLHLAARQMQLECLHILLDNGSLVCASTDRYGCPRNTPLHLAARERSLDCIRKLLAWGTNHLQRDASGRIPYIVAVKHKHGACAALLIPSSAEPLVWPAPLKFISELNEEAKSLLEQTLMEANRERKKNILKGTAYSLPSPSHSDSGLDDNISKMTAAQLVPYKGENKVICIPVVMAAKLLPIDVHVCLTSQAS